MIKTRSVRPNDAKDLNRFIRNGKTFLLAENSAGKITHRSADETEMEKWKNALALHKAWAARMKTSSESPLNKTAPFRFSSRTLRARIVRIAAWLRIQSASFASKP